MAILVSRFCRIIEMILGNADLQGYSARDRISA